MRNYNTTNNIDDIALDENNVSALASYHAAATGESAIYMSNLTNDLAGETPVALPAGFSFGSTAAGIKYAHRLDLAVLICDSPCPCAGVFTQNRFTAAPVVVSRETLSAGGGISAGVITNSGCANAATGDEGYASASKMAQAGAAAVGVEGSLLVCSTGTIGVQLPMEKIEAALPSLAVSVGKTPADFESFADAILTTDTIRKIASSRFEYDGTTVSITGCAKGSGMMHPQMATMLAYVVTDAKIEPALLHSLFLTSVEHSLNCVTVDGDTSTNDTALLFASGASGVTINPAGAERDMFVTALDKVMQSLARQLARDGEGATKLIEVHVSGAPTYIEARKAAFAVANSPLVKTAIYGRDANWGRIACALGYSGVAFDSSKTDISISGLELMRAGAPINFSEERALEILAEKTIIISAHLHAGSERAEVYTCDLTEKYIEINGSYRT